MRVAVVMLSLLCACQSMPENLGPGAYNDYEWHSASSVNEVVPGVMESLGYTLSRHEFDGACGYVKAVTPTGATTEVRWDWVFEDQTYLQVSSVSHAYSDRLSDAVLEEISRALKQTG